MTLKASGVRAIAGRIVGDDNAFDDETVRARVGVGRSRRTATARRSARLQYNENVALATVAPGASRRRAGARHRHAARQRPHRGQPGEHIARRHGSRLIWCAGGRRAPAESDRHRAARRPAPVRADGLGRQPDAVLRHRRCATALVGARHRRPRPGRRHRRHCRRRRRPSAGALDQRTRRRRCRRSPSG